MRKDNDKEKANKTKATPSLFFDILSPLLTLLKSKSQPSRLIKLTDEQALRLQ